MAFGVWFGGSHLGFGTHMPTLAAAVLGARAGPVLEYGLGFYSTPLLHLLCAEMGRDLLSLDGDPAWAEQFADLRSPQHRIVGVSDWRASEPLVDATPEWAVALIDHGPESRRVVDCERLRQKVEFLVVHDWDVSGGHPGQRAVRAMFEHYWTSKVGPNTAVLSNVRAFKGVTL